MSAASIIHPSRIHGYVKVSKGAPCPICKKPDWCLVSISGNTAICARVPSNQRAGDAGWYHQLTEKPLEILQSDDTKKPVTKLNPEVLHAAYTALLNALSLSGEHYRALLSRGLNSAQIHKLQYRTLPISDRRNIIRKLKACTLDGVPGFWKDDFSWRHDIEKYRLAGSAGILIPVRSIQGQVQGCQIRCDHDDGGGKYRWLSSGDKPNGTPSGAPIHVAQPEMPETSEIWITEGPIKADVASIKLKKIVLAVPGVSNWAGVLPILNELKPEGVIVSFDMDKLTNPNVERHKNELLRRLIALSFKTYEASWNQAYKGVDDMLAGRAVQW